MSFTTLSLSTVPLHDPLLFLCRSLVFARNLPRQMTHTATPWSGFPADDLRNLGTTSALHRLEAIVDVTINDRSLKVIDSTVVFTFVPPRGETPKSRIWCQRL